MDEHVAEVKDDPAPGGRTFGPSGSNARFRHPFADGAIDGAQLTFVCAGGNDKIVGERRKMVDIEHDRVASGRITDDVGQIERALPTRRGR